MGAQGQGGLRLLCQRWSSPSSPCGAEAAHGLEEERSPMCCPTVANTSQQEAVRRTPSPNWQTESGAESQAPWCPPAWGARGVGGL